jgi:ubiquinone/menaquinone biosynthesis C-methylase UbiE
MSDVWSSVKDLEPEVQDRLAGVLETRGGDPAQQAMRRELLERIPFPASAKVLEVGCGTGVLCRTMAGWPGVESVDGVDPAPSLIARAMDLAAAIANVWFSVGDGRDLPFGDGAFDVVVFDSTLCHIPGPDSALAEAVRVLCPEGVLAAFDGDYATTTVSLGANDPLQACVDAMMANSVTDRWLVRRLPQMVRATGLDVLRVDGYDYVESGAASYLLTVVDRGADLLASNGEVSADTAACLKAEARQRVDTGTFFGHIAYGSVIARKPATN